MSIKSFTPCSDWFFVFKNQQGKAINYRLAGWAICEGEDGGNQVIGMVSVEGGGDSPAMPKLCRLVTVPPVAGTYKHVSELKAHS